MSDIIIKLLLASIALTVTFLILEIILRLFWFNPYADSSANHLLWIRRHNPGLRMQIDRRAIVENNRFVYFETDERSYIKPSRRFKDADYDIVFVGGSTTECLAVTDTLRFHHVVGCELEKRGLEVNALNIGHEGNTMHEALNLVLNHVLIDKPDFIVLMHACNDISILRTKPDYSTKMGGPVTMHSIQHWVLQICSEKSWMAAFLNKKLDSLSRIIKHDNMWDERHQELVKKYDQEHGFKKDDGTRCKNYRARLETFVDICNNFDIVPVLMTQPTGALTTVITPPWLEESIQFQFNQVIREVCTEKEAVLIDLQKHITEDIEDFNVPLKVFYDGLHVCDCGSIEYGKYIAEQLYEEISQEQMAALER